MGLLGIGGGFGLQGWMQAFDSSAAKVSAAADLASNGQPASPNGPDLTDGMVGMDLASIGIQASITAIRTADEMVGTILDLRA